MAFQSYYNEATGEHTWNDEVTSPTASPSSSQSSVPCAPGFHKEEINGEWQCVPDVKADNPTKPTTDPPPVVDTPFATKTVDQPKAVVEQPKAATNPLPVSPSGTIPQFTPTALPPASSPVSFSGVNIPAPYQPMAPYVPKSVEAFKMPDFSAEENLQRQAIQKVLANPYSLNDTAVNQMKESQKENTLLYNKQLVDQAKQTAASRNALGGGAAQAAERRLNEDAIKEILKGNQRVDIQKATQDRTDELQAMGSVTDILNNALGRSTSAYTTGLQGAGFNANEGQKAYDSAVQQNQFGYNSQVDAAKIALQKALGEGTLSMQGNDQQLSWAKFLESMRQFNKQLAFDYGTVGLPSQNPVF